MNTIPNDARRARRSSRRGYTLLEMLIAISLMSLLFLGAMDLVISSSRTTVRSQAQIFATGDSANTIQNIIGKVREAQSFTLPTSQTAGTAEDGWTTPSGTSLSKFSTTLSGQVINTAVEITAPPTLTPALNGYKPSVLTIQVQNTAGTGSWSITPYSCQTAGTVVTLIYRGDPDGTPDPDPTGSAVSNAGTYLWQYTIPSDGSFNLVTHPPTLLCKSVSISPNGVQFVRPTYASVPEPNQLEVKIISGYYSPINGTQTNEEGNGASTSELTGKCVYMRDHLPNPKAKTNVSQSSNNPFQYH